MVLLCVLVFLIYFNLFCFYFFKLAESGVGRLDVKLTAVVALLAISIGFVKL